MGTLCAAWYLQRMSHVESLEVNRGSGKSDLVELERYADLGDEIDSLATIEQLGVMRHALDP